MPRPPLSATALDDLADVRTLLNTALHNLQAATRHEQPATALDATIAMTEQSLTTLRRVRTGLGSSA